ncbi:MAG: rhomboid family intramembrane serine protease [Solirubrobacteraceae bacterium]
MLIVINVIVFLWEVAGGTTLSGSSVAGYAFQHGVLYGPRLADGYHQYWRLITYAFLHESIFHIGMNMFSLWFVGRVLEPAIGKGFYLAIYFSAALAGAFGALVFTPQVPSLGASGAIFGVFGALIMVARARRIPLWQSGLIPVLLFNLIFTLMVPGVSIGGHVGGLLSGLASGWLVTEYAEKRSRRAYVYAGCVLIAIISVVGGILVAGGTGLLPNGSTI